MAHTNGMESFWSSSHTGTFHRVSPEHLSRCVTEFEGRYNIREQDTADELMMVTQPMDGRPLLHTDLIAPNGLDSGARDG